MKNQEELMPAESSEKMLVLEGIRGIAAFMVILDHLHLAFFGEMDGIIGTYLNIHTPFLVSKAGQYLVTGLHDGNFAVWVFWVMSAFVLSRKYFQLIRADRGEDGAGYLAKSVVKRYPRLFVPILASVVFAYLLLSAGLMTNNDLGARLGEHTSPGWLFTFYEFDPSLPTAIKSAAWDAFFDFDRDTTYNTVLWTMEPEFFGSIFLFGFLSLLGNKRIRWIAYPLIITILYLRGTHWLNAFVFGILLCDLYVNSTVFTGAGRRLGSPWIQTLSPAAILVFIGAPNYGEVFHLIVAVALVFMALSFGRIGRFFSARVPVYLGRISFSLYLIHVPILCSLTGFLYRAAEPWLAYPGAAIISSILTIAACILAAHVFHKYADTLGVRLGGRLAESVKYQG